MVEHRDLDAHLAGARRWEQDLLLSAHRSRRLAWGAAGLATCLAVVAVGAVAALAPLKTVEPFVIRVDDTTGIVDVVSSLKDTSGTYGEAVARYFLARYVQAREGYSHAEAGANFRTASLLSTPAEQQRFAQTYRGANPDSPQVVHGRNGVVAARIKTIALLGPKLASVRFLRAARQGDEAEKASHWIATVTFEIRPEVAISAQDRLVNPIGFLVSEYRVDPEVLP